jgi:hypothetical protein
MRHSSMWRWLRSLTLRGPVASPSLRPVVVPSGDPYREDPATRPMERTAEPRTLDEVLAALRDADLAFRPRRRGFDLEGAARERVMPVRVREIARIVPEDMSCGTEAPELLLDLALAMVPLFGPLVADVRFAGAIIVDGKRDRVALGEDAAERIQRMGRRVATRAPIVYPILIDLARRMRNPR